MRIDQRAKALSTDRRMDKPSYRFTSLRLKTKRPTTRSWPLGLSFFPVFQESLFFPVFSFSSASKVSKLFSHRIYSTYATFKTFSNRLGDQQRRSRRRGISITGFASFLLSSISVLLRLVLLSTLLLEEETSSTDRCILR